MAIAKAPSAGPAMCGRTAEIAGPEAAAGDRAERDRAGHDEEAGSRASTDAGKQQRRRSRAARRASSRRARRAIQDERRARCRRRTGSRARAGSATGSAAERRRRAAGWPTRSATSGIVSIRMSRRMLCAIATFFMSAFRPSAAAMTKDSAPGSEASSASFRVPAAAAVQPPIGAGDQHDERERRGWRSSPARSASGAASPA